MADDEEEVGEEENSNNLGVCSTLSYLMSSTNEI